MSATGRITYAWTGAPSAYRAYQGALLIGMVKREGQRWVGLPYATNFTPLREADGKPAYVRASSRTACVEAMQAARSAYREQSGVTS